MDQGGIDEAEDRHADSHAQGKDEDGREGKAEIVPQLSKRETQVLYDTFPAKGNQDVTLFAQMRGIAELARSRDVSGLMRHSGGQQVLFCLRAVEGHLLVEVSAEAIAVKQESHFFCHSRDEVHDATSGRGC